MATHEQLELANIKTNNRNHKHRQMRYVITSAREFAPLRRKTQYHDASWRLPLGVAQFDKQQQHERSLYVRVLDVPMLSVVCGVGMAKLMTQESRASST